MRHNIDLKLTTSCFLPNEWLYLEPFPATLYSFSALKGKWAYRVFVLFPKLMIWNWSPDISHRVWALFSFNRRKAVFSIQGAKGASQEQFHSDLKISAKVLASPLPRRKLNSNSIYWIPDSNEIPFFPPKSQLIQLPQFPPLDGAIAVIRLLWESFLQNLVVRDFGGKGLVVAPRWFRR